MDDVELIIPWHKGCPHREQALQWVFKRLDRNVTLPLGRDPWIKALAVMPAVKHSDASIVVIHDADVFTDGLALAIQAVADGAPWAQPHRKVHRLTEAATAAVLEGADWHAQQLEQPPYLASVRCGAGGIMVAKREVLLDIPLDPRFIGWGQEDVSHDLALTTLVGQPWRGEADLVHLWHPPQPRLSRRVGSQTSWDLFCRYHEARLDSGTMLTLIGEAHAALELANSGRTDHPAQRV
jgi:hypothetical protein